MMCFASHAALARAEPPSDRKEDYGGQKEAQSGSTRTNDCQVPQFSLKVNSSEIIVVGIEGPTRVVVAHPNLIEPVLELEIATERDRPAIVPLPNLERDVPYLISASRVCDPLNPSKNPSARLEFRI